MEKLPFKIYQKSHNIFEFYSGGKTISKINFRDINVSFLYGLSLGIPFPSVVDKKEILKLCEIKYKDIRKQYRDALVKELAISDTKRTPEGYGKLVYKVVTAINSDSFPSNVYISQHGLRVKDNLKISTDKSGNKLVVMIYEPDIDGSSRNLPRILHEKRLLGIREALGFPELIESWNMDSGGGFSAVLDFDIENLAIAHSKYVAFKDQDEQELHSTDWWKNLKESLD